MGKHDDVIAQLSERKRLDQDALNDYEAGVREEYELRNGDRVNVTPNTVARLKDSISKLARLITSYEKNNA